MEEEVEEDPQIVFKQKIIQREILHKNYDKNLFFNFCISRKENGDDLANWSLKEIMDCIHDFTDSQDKNKKTQEEKDKAYREVLRQAEEVEINIEKLKENKMFSASNGLSSSCIKEITCKKIEKSKLNDIESSVVISDPQVINANIFSSTYITYEVKTLPFNWIVRRRYSDFEWLKNTLSKHYPLLFVSPMPKKKLGSRRFESDFVEKRMKFLQRFLDNLMNVELFKASDAMIAFLSETDRPSYENKMKELTPYTPSNYVEEIRNLTGYVLTSNDDDANEKYYTNIYNYFHLQGLLFERLNYNMKYFYQSMSSACRNLEEIQKDFETLHLLNSRVLMKEEVTKSFEELGIFFKNWKRILFNQNEMIKIHLKDFFNFNRMECNTYKELVENRNKLKEEYTQENTKLTNKKEKLWIGMDITKWGIIGDMANIDQGLLFRDKRYAFEKMCTEETTALDNLYKQLCYSNRTNIDEIKGMIARYSNSYVKQIKRFTDEMYPSLNDGLQVWTNLAAFIDAF